MTVGDIILRQGLLWLDLGEMGIVPVSANIADGQQAVRRGDGICRWSPTKTGVDSLTVLTDGPSGSNPGIYYNIQPGEVVFVSYFCFGVLTASDWVDAELGYTDAVDGGGTFIPMSPPKRMRTGTTPTGHAEEGLPIFPAARVPAGAKSVTMRVQANDAAAEVRVAWHGWVERTVQR